MKVRGAERQALRLASVCKERELVFFSFIELGSTNICCLRLQEILTKHTNILAVENMNKCSSSENGKC